MKIQTSLYNTIPKAKDVNIQRDFQKETGPATTCSDNMITLQELVINLSMCP